MFTQQELEVIDRLKQEGKTPDQIAGFIGGKRLNKPSTISREYEKLKEPETKTQIIQSLRETGGDLKETFLQVGETLNKARENVVTNYLREDRNPISKGFDMAGSVVGGVSKSIFGDVPLGLAKTLVPQKTEDLVAQKVTELVTPIVETPEVQSLIQTYSSLDDNQKQDLRTAGNFGMALVDLLGLKGVTNIGKTKSLSDNIITPEIKSGNLAQEPKVLQPQIGSQLAPEQSISPSTPNILNQKVIQEPTLSQRAGDFMNRTRQTTDNVKTEKSQARIKAESEAPKLNFTEKAIGLTESDKSQIIGKSDKMREYIDVVKTRNLTTNAPSAMEFGGDQVRNAATQMEQLLNTTGSRIGQTRQKLSNVKANVDSVKSIESTFKDQLNKLNLEVRRGKTKSGKIVEVIVPKKGSVSRVGTTSDIKTMQSLWNELKTVKQSPTLENLIDYRNLVQKNIEFGKSAREVSDALNAPAQAIRKQVKEVADNIVGKSGAKDLQEYTDFINAFEEIKSFTDRKAGGEYLLRVLESGRGGEARQVVNTIKKHTGIDLQDDATMMRLVTQLLADQSQKTQFTQQITNAGLDTARILAGDNLKLGEKIFGKVMEKVADPEKVLLEASKDKLFGGSFNKAKSSTTKKPFDRTKQGGFVRIGKETPTAKPVYRGTGGAQSGKASIYGKGTYFAESKDVASKYGKVSSTKIDTTKFFDGTKNLPQDVQSIFVDRLSKEMNIPKQDILNDLKISEMMGNEDYYSIISNIQKPKGIKAEVFESDVADVLNTILKEKGFKGVKGFELANGNFTKNAIYNQFPDSPPTKSKVNESVSSLNDSTLLKEAKKYKSAEEFVKAWGTPVYRGQTKKGGVDFNETGFQGNTEGGVFFTPDSKIAGKYGDNIVENISTKKNTVSVKESDELQKMATTQVEKDLKNMVESDELIEQMALGRPRAFAEYTKKPFIETGDKFGETGELIYYKELDKTPQTKSQLEQIWKEANKK